MLFSAIAKLLVKNSRFLLLNKLFGQTKRLPVVASGYQQKMSTLTAVPDERNIAWIDMEMTGLDVSKDKIIEVACIITGPNLNETVEGPNLVLHTSDEILNSMDEWCKNTHGSTGLIDEVKRSKLTVEEVEQQLLDFVSQYCPPGRCPLGGNSVHMDRQFLARDMPRLVNHLHYRIIDVSSVKELVKRWYPDSLKEMPERGKGSNLHRAMVDIRESINELKWYREHVFRKNN